MTKKKEKVKKVQIFLAQASQLRVLSGSRAVLKMILLHKRCLNELNKK